MSDVTDKDPPDDLRRDDQPRGDLAGDLPEQEQQFEAYLRGESAVSRQYRQLHSAEVPAELDRLVMRQAQEAVRGRAAKSRAWIRWSAPLAFAASAVLVVSIVMESGVQDEVLLTAPVSAPVEMKVLRERAEDSVERTASDTAAPAAEPAQEMTQESINESINESTQGTAQESVQNLRQNSRQNSGQHSPQYSGQERRPESRPESAQESAQESRPQSRQESTRESGRDSAKASDRRVPRDRATAGAASDAPVAPMTRSLPAPQVITPELQRPPPPELTIQIPATGLEPPAHAEPPAQESFTPPSIRTTAHKRAEEAAEYDLSEVAVTGSAGQRRTAGPRNTVAVPAEPSGGITATEDEPRSYSDPEKWLHDIRELRKNNKHEQADREWRRFRDVYPNYAVDEADPARGS